MSWYYPPLDICLLRCPKTGTRTIHQHLMWITNNNVEPFRNTVAREVEDPRFYESWHDPTVGENDRFVITSIRHPVHWLRSYLFHSRNYFNLDKSCVNNNDGQHTYDCMGNEICFCEEFIDRLPADTVGAIFRTYTQNADFVIRTENLFNDLHNALLQSGYVNGLSSREHDRDLNKNPYGKSHPNAPDSLPDMSRSMIDKIQSKESIAMNYYNFEEL